MLHKKKLWMFSCRLNGIVTLNKRNNLEYSSELPRMMNTKKIYKLMIPIKDSKLKKKSL